MLVATDPLSGVTARQLVAVNTPGEGSRDFFRKFEQEQVFIVVSVVLAAFLATVLAILVREKNHA
jgi:ABC-type sugar transport system permease subunit